MDICYSADWIITYAAQAGYDVRVLPSIILVFTTTRLDVWKHNKLDGRYCVTPSSGA